MTIYMTDFIFENVDFCGVFPKILPEYIFPKRGLKAAFYYIMVF